jgi:hypothetical protein
LLPKPAAAEQTTVRRNFNKCETAFSERTIFVPPTAFSERTIFVPFCFVFFSPQ